MTARLDMVRLHLCAKTRSRSIGLGKRVVSTTGVDANLRFSRQSAANLHAKSLCLFVPEDISMPRLAAGANASVLRLLAARHTTQIRPSVVESIAVDVIDLDFRMGIHQPPMQEDVPLLQANARVDLTALGTRCADHVCFDARYVLRRQPDSLRDAVTTGVQQEGRSSVASPRACHATPRDTRLPWHRRLCSGDGPLRGRGSNRGPASSYASAA